MDINSQIVSSSGQGLSNFSENLSSPGLFYDPALHNQMVQSGESSSLQIGSEIVETPVGEVQIEEGKISSANTSQQREVPEGNTLNSADPALLEPSTAATSFAGSLTYSQIENLQEKADKNVSGFKKSFKKRFKALFFKKKKESERSSLEPGPVTEGFSFGGLSRIPTQKFAALVHQHQPRRLAFETSYSSSAPSRQSSLGIVRTPRDQSSAILAHNYKVSTSIQELEDYILQSENQSKKGSKSTMSPDIENKAVEIHKYAAALITDLARNAFNDLFVISENCSRLGFKYDEYLKLYGMASQGQSSQSGSGVVLQTPPYLINSPSTLVLEARKNAERYIALNSLDYSYIFAKVENTRTADTVFDVLKRALEREDYYYYDQATERYKDPRFVTNLSTLVKEKLPPGTSLLPLCTDECCGYPFNKKVRTFYTISANSQHVSSQTEIDTILEGCVKLLKVFNETPKTRQIVEELFRNIIITNTKTLEVDHLFNEEYRCCLDEGITSSTRKAGYDRVMSVLTTKLVNMIKGHKTNRLFYPEPEFQRIKSLGLVEYLVQFFAYQMRDNSMRLALQL